MAIVPSGGPDGDIRVAGVGEGDRFSRQKLEVPVGSDVDDDVCPEDLFEVVVGGEVLVGRRNLWVVEDLADLAVASRACATPLRLDADNDVAVIYARDHDFSVEDHGGGNAVLLLSRRLSPGIADLMPRLEGQGLKPPLIVLPSH